MARAATRSSARDAESPRGQRRRSRPDRAGDVRSGRRRPAARPTGPAQRYAVAASAGCRRRLGDTSISTRPSTSVGGELRALGPALADRQLDARSRSRASGSARRRPGCSRRCTSCSSASGVTVSVRPLRASVCCDLVDLLQRDLPDFVLRQRREDHDFVDAVAELRREPAFELAHHFPLDLLDADLLR